MSVNFRGFEVMTVIAVAVYEGAGTTGDPGRVVTTYFSKDGRQLWRDDPIEDRGENGTRGVA